jgi:hypothetical protein
MGTILASVVIDKAATLIQDKTGVRWPMDEMLGWLCSGQRQIVLMRPDASSRTSLYQAAAGTRQTLPVGAIRLLGVIRNMGQDGASPGRVITYVERSYLDSQLPNWHFENPNAVMKHYTYDDREPQTWYCWPPQPSTGRGQVDIMTSESPAAPTVKDVKNEDGTTGTVTTAISIDDIYENPLVDYIVYRAHLKDAEFASGPRAQVAYTTFLQSLGLRSASDKAFSAANNAPPMVDRNAPATGRAFGQQ